MTKSPLKMARMAMPIAPESLSAYSSKFSTRRYTQHPLFALLALREFLKLDYCGLEQILKEKAELRQVLGLEKVSDHSTNQWGAERLFEKAGPMTSYGGRRGPHAPAP